MANRRNTLLGIVGAWSAMIANAAFGKNEASPTPVAPAGKVGLSESEAVEKALRADLARFKSRVYSEEGVPVFLACEDLAAVKAGSPAVPTPAFSQRFATDFRKNSEAWHRIHPDAPAGDVSTVIEVLADRDFRRDGKGGRS